MGKFNNRSISHSILIMIAAAIVGAWAGAITYGITHIKTLTRIETLEKTCRSVN